MANAAGGSRSVCVEAQELKHLLQGAAWLRYVVPEAGNSVLELVGVTTAVQEDDGRVCVAQVLHCSLAVHEETPEAGFVDADRTVLLFQIGQQQKIYNASCLATLQHPVRSMLPGGKGQLSKQQAADVRMGITCLKTAHDWLQPIHQILTAPGHGYTMAQLPDLLSGLRSISSRASSSCGYSNSSSDSSGEIVWKILLQREGPVHLALQELKQQHLPRMLYEDFELMIALLGVALAGLEPLIAARRQLAPQQLQQGLPPATAVVRVQHELQGMPAQLMQGGIGTKRPADTLAPSAETSAPADLDAVATGDPDVQLSKRVRMSTATEPSAPAGQHCQTDSRTVFLQQHNIAKSEADRLVTSVAADVKIQLKAAKTAAVPLKKLLGNKWARRFHANPVLIAEYMQQYPEVFIVQQQGHSRKRRFNVSLQPGAAHWLLRNQEVQGHLARYKRKLIAVAQQQGYVAWQAAASHNGTNALMEGELVRYVKVFDKSSEFMYATLSDVFIIERAGSDHHLFPKQQYHG